MCPSMTKCADMCVTVTVLITLEYFYDRLTD